MAPINYSIVSKGEYDNGKNPPLVYPKHYIFLKNNKREKFLSLRFFNGLDLSLTYVEFILFQLDSAGNVIKKFRVREDVNRAIPGKTFSLPSGIKLCDKCVDFRIQMVEARCGKYSYSLKYKNSAAVYSIDNKWNYDPDRQGYYSEHIVSSRMQRRFPLVKFLAFVTMAAVVAIGFYPVLEYIFEHIR